MIFEKKGRGYDHQKHMSVNAKIAHDSGEMPISEWEKMSKKNLIDFIVDEEGYDSVEAKIIADFINGNTKVHIISVILKFTSIHHVGEGALLRGVEFYKLDDDYLNSLADAGKAKACAENLKAFGEAFDEEEKDDERLIKDWADRNRSKVLEVLRNGQQAREADVEPLKVGDFDFDENRTKDLIQSVAMGRTEAPLAMAIHHCLFD